MERAQSARWIRTLTFDPLPFWERGRKEAGFFAAGALNDTGIELKIERHASRFAPWLGVRRLASRKIRGPSASLGMTQRNFARAKSNGFGMTRGNEQR